VGSIGGRVTLNGVGVFGAHVTAFNPVTGDLVGTFVLGQDGTFVLATLKPGVYVVRAEPLDDADLDSFFDADTRVETGFRPAYASRLIGVDAGGGAEAGEIKVPAK
jgi:hypothetical protein